MIPSLHTVGYESPDLWKHSLGYTFALSSGWPIGVLNVRNRGKLGLSKQLPDPPFELRQSMRSWGMLFC